jgi:hypothetical protein
VLNSQKRWFPARTETHREKLVHASQSTRVLKLVLSLLISLSLMSATAFLAFCATLLQYSDDPPRESQFCTDFCPRAPGAVKRP